MELTPISVVVGIDVSKDTLDIAIGLEQAVWQAGNDLTGIARVVQQLCKAQPSLVVIESTGGLERNIIAELCADGLPVALVHPGRVREYAKSAGLLAKTDRLDARILVRFGVAIGPQPTRLPSVAEQELAALVTRRHQVIEMQVAERNRLPTAPATVKERISKHLVWLQEELDALEQEIETFIHQNPLWQEKEQLLRTAGGVGPITACTLLDWSRYSPVSQPADSSAVPSRATRCPPALIPRALILSGSMLYSALCALRSRTAHLTSSIMAGNLVW